MVYDIMNDGQRKHYEETLECDFSFEIPNLARFRVNAFVQNRGRRRSSGRFRQGADARGSGRAKIFRDIAEYPAWCCAGHRADRFRASRRRWRR